MTQALNIEPALKGNSGLFSLTPNLDKCQKHIFHGLELVLDPSGAVWIPSSQALLVADLHLEKGSSFARKGQLVPPYDTRQTLQKLGALIANYQPKRVITLGDNFHDEEGLNRLSRADRALLTMLSNQTVFVWIEGNHDNKDFYNDHNFQDKKLIDLWTTKKNETFMHEEYTLNNVSLVHDASIVSQRPVIAGHLHPVAVLKHRGVSVRKKCFYAGKDVFLLPSFGTYTGGLNIRHKAFDDFWCNETKAFLITNDQVFPAPTAQLVNSARK